MNANLKEISNFIKKNKSYSDFNLVDNFLLNLNFTKINFKNNLKNNLVGGNLDIIEANTDNSLDAVKPVIHTYTIKKGTLLYHTTLNKKESNKHSNFNQDKSIDFFTPNYSIVTDKLYECSNNTQNGYIHVYKVIKDIPNIYIELFNDIKNIDNLTLHINEFCHKNQNYNGIGFFYPKNNIELFANNSAQSNEQIQSIIMDSELYYSEFCLSNLKDYIKYSHSQKCHNLNN